MWQPGPAPTFGGWALVHSCCSYPLLPPPTSLAHLQVQACRYIDQRAYGGLTPLHFTVVAGRLEAVQVLLQAGASIMVKTGE